MTVRTRKVFIKLQENEKSAPSPFPHLPSFQHKVSTYDCQQPREDRPGVFPLTSSGEAANSSHAVVFAAGNGLVVVTDGAVLSTVPVVPHARQSAAAVAAVAHAGS